MQPTERLVPHTTLLIVQSSILAINSLSRLHLARWTCTDRHREPSFRLGRSLDTCRALIVVPTLTDEDLDAKLEFPGPDHPTVPEDLHPLVQDLVEDEIHNNHTTWSVIRTHHREALAEALAVFVQLTIGFCADLSVTVAAAGNPNTTAWA